MNIKKQYRPIEAKGFGDLRKLIGILLTPVEKVCDFIVRRPYTSFVILWGSIFATGYLYSMRVAGGMALGVLVIFLLSLWVEREVAYAKKEEYETFGVPDEANPALKDIAPYNIHKSQE